MLRDAVRQVAVKRPVKCKGPSPPKKTLGYARLTLHPSCMLSLSFHAKGTGLHYSNKSKPSEYYFPPKDKFKT